ncbi:MAG: DUF368 domain-containing protein [Planctomycetota bacterium]
MPEPSLETEHPGTPPKGRFADVPPALIARATVGGGLMGLANLVPGISGGTMLVAAGVYQQFIDAVSDVTRLRFSIKAVVLLGSVLVGAAIAIVAFVKLVTLGLVEARWAMYSGFIGLTLGGVPLMVGLVRPFTTAAWAGVVGGVVVMAGLVVLQERGAIGPAGEPGIVMLVLGGVAGASAMILPGISGAYLLLLLGLYETLVTAIDQTKDAVKAADINALMEPLKVVVPVGIGVVVGIAVVGNLLRFLLHRFEKATLGVLLGLLIAAPAGLYPFREGVQPVPGDVIKGETVTEENLAEFESDPKDWEQRTFTPSPIQIAGSLGLIAVGFGLTFGLARLSAPRPAEETPAG